MRLELENQVDLMNINIPLTIEKDVSRFAAEQNLTPQEALIKLIKAGLKLSTPGGRGLGLFSSPEDSEALDQVVSLAYEERKMTVQEQEI